MVSVSISEARAKLSKLVKLAKEGEEIVITAGRDKYPVARLVSLHPVEKKRLGACETPGFVIPKEFFDPLPEEELRLWDGCAE